MTAVIDAPWSNSNVGAQFEIQLGKMLDSARNVGVSKHYLGNRAVQWGRVDLSAVGVVPLTLGDQARFRLKTNDLLVCEGGEVGRAAIWRDELRECYYQKALHRLRPKTGYDPRVMLALLEYWSSTNVFTNFVTQTSIAHLPREKFLSMPLPMIPAQEQMRLGEILDDLNDTIASLERLTAKKQAIKHGIMQNLLTGKTRLPGFDESWREVRLGELLSYEQPGRYLVTSTKQLDSGRVPVLTAGKTFILGYTNDCVGVYTQHPVVIFDDFTTASKYVDFDFKAKSSAMKILSARKGVANLRFIHEKMQLIDFPIGDHKRHWISECSQHVVNVPNLSEQKAIAGVLADADRGIHQTHQLLTKVRCIKQGMMQELLTGRTRLAIEEGAA